LIIMPKTELPNATAPPLAPNITGLNLTDSSETARRMLNEKQVLAIVPVGHTTLWRLEKAGRFPRSTYISPNRRIWFEDEVAAWQKQIEGQGRGGARLKT
jgi:predicted DNA-binding transcriptional regulator AlpA